MQGTQQSTLYSFMKNRITILTAIVGIAISGNVFAQENAAAPAVFTLQQCIDYANEHNPNLKNAKASVEASEAKVGEIIATGLPQVTGFADLGDNYLIPTTWIPAKVFDPSAPDGALAPVKFGTQYTGRATLDVNQMIFNGSYFVGLKASRTYTELSRVDLVSSKIDLVAAIKKAYYSVLVNRERQALIENNAHRLDSLLQQTKAMYQNGFAEKIDVSRIQVQVNNINNTKRSSAIGLEVSSNLLKFQMGLPISTQLTLADSLSDIQLQVLDPDFKSGFAYANRIEYQKLGLNHTLTELDIKNTRAQYLPSLNFYGNYGASYGTSNFNNFMAFGDNWKTFGAFGLRLNVPIFDGFMKRKQVQQKQIKLDQIENMQTLTRGQIDMEQSQVSLSFLNTIEALKVQKENMTLAEEVYNVTVIKYQQGVGSNIEVLNADASYKEAQTNYYAALYDALITSVDLEKAYGKITIAEK
jgi:outer membrane protein TolC